MFFHIVFKALYKLLDMFFLERESYGVGAAARTALSASKRLHPRLAEYVPESLAYFSLLMDALGELCRYWGCTQDAHSARRAANAKTMNVFFFMMSLETCLTVGISLKNDLNIILWQLSSPRRGIRFSL